jgi:hypothetical protein
LSRLAVRCWLNSRCQTSMLLSSGHLNLSLRYVTLHSSSRPSYVVPRQLLQTPVLRLGRLVSGCPVTAIVPICRSVCNIRLRRLCNVVLG